MPRKGNIMNYRASLQRILFEDPLRMSALNAVRAMKLNDGWIGAGFVRDAVWDRLHGMVPGAVFGDVDVVWFDAKLHDATHDKEREKRLCQLLPSLDWSVKNQARMHHRNGHAPYRSTEDALRYWPETATAVAVRLGEDKTIDVIAPYGLDDLFELRLKPTPSFKGDTLTIFNQRVVEKRWQERYWMLTLV